MVQDKQHRAMTRNRLYARLLPTTMAVALFYLLSCTNVSAQMFRVLDASANAGFFASGSMLYQPKTHVSGGGDITLTSYRVSTAGFTPVTDKLRFGLGVTYEFDDYNFARLEGFAVPDPWNKVHKVGLAPMFAYRLQPDWNLFFTPIAQYSAEQGADFDKSIMYGGVAGAVYRVKPNLHIGMGAGVFYRLEQTTLIPSLLISWRITDRVRLGNSGRLGPAGPAGLELSYSFDRDWNFAVGAGYRSNRFRLDRNGVVPSGIGQNTSAPVYARVGYRLGRHFLLDVYAGATFGGSLRLEDRRGNEIDTAHYKTAPIMGLTLMSFF